jgi:hypothetical protein
MVYTQYGAVKTVKHIQNSVTHHSTGVQHNIVQYGTAYHSTAGV